MQKYPSRQRSFEGSIRIYRSRSSMDSELSPPKGTVPGSSPGGITKNDKKMENRISVDVHVESETEVTRRRNRKDEWDQDDLRHTNTIQGWHRSDGGPYSVDPDKKAYAVYMVYSTGDSFHTEDGLMEVMMVNQDFEMVKKNIAAIEEACKRDEEKWSIELFTDDGTIVKLSNPAAGYFEHLQYADYEVIDEVRGPR